MRNSTSPFLQSHSSARHSRGEMAKGASRSSPSSRKKRRTKPGLGKGRRTKSKTGLPPAVRKHADILCLLSRSSPAQARRILNSGLGDAGLVRALAECSHNVLSGALSLTPNQHRRLKRHKTALRRLTADHRGLGKRRGSRRALTRHRALLMRGGFLGSLLGVVAPLIAGALGKVIGSEWREQQQQQHTYIQPRTWGRRPRLQARAWRKWFWCDHPSFLDCQQQQQEVNSVGVGCPPPPSQPVAVASGSRRESNLGGRKRPGRPLPEAPHSAAVSHRRWETAARGPRSPRSGAGSGQLIDRRRTTTRMETTCISWRRRRLHRSPNCGVWEGFEGSWRSPRREAPPGPDETCWPTTPNCAMPWSSRTWDPPCKGQPRLLSPSKECWSRPGTARTATVKRMTETRMKRLSVMWWPWESTWCRPAWPWGPGLCSGSSGRLMPAEGSWLGPNTPRSWC